MKTNHRYSIEMILSAIKKYVPVDGFLNMLLFDYLIGNSDRHQSNWAVVLNEEGMRWSPLYDNSSSLCAYVQENQIDNYLGNDKNRWRALVDTKSKSLIRRTVDEEKRPTHLKMLKYLNENYPEKTQHLAKKITTVLTEEKICNILSHYTESGLTVKKKALIKKYILCKVDMMRDICFGKEE